MAKFVPDFLDKVLTFEPDPGLTDAVSIASKAMRLKIITDRYTRGFSRAEVAGPKDKYETEKYRKLEKNKKEHREKLGKIQPDNQGYISEYKRRLSRVDNYIKDYISIIDIDYKPSKHKATRYYSSIQLPFIPGALDINPESKFVGIASLGRNNPHYHFTGSEDTITFEIDWLSTNESADDVIFNCRWLEALTKADGYNEPPHRVSLAWGNDNKLFQDYLWLLVSAPYKLLNFSRGFYKGEQLVRNNLLPRRAHQTVTLKRLTDHNLLSSEIINKI